MNKYFKDEYDYPPIGELGGLPENTLFEYVSNAFLNGFINYVSKIEGWVIPVYSDENGWKTVKRNVDLMNDSRHTKLEKAGDNVVVLAETDKDYWLFYFDYAISDCSVGRFSKEGNCRAQVISDFREYASAHRKDYATPLKVKFNGWVSFF